MRALNANHHRRTMGVAVRSKNIRMFPILILMPFFAANSVFTFNENDFDSQFKRPNGFNRMKFIRLNRWEVNFSFEASRLDVKLKNG